MGFQGGKPLKIPPSWSFSMTGTPRTVPTPMKNPRPLLLALLLAHVAGARLRRRLAARAERPRPPHRDRSRQYPALGRGHQDLLGQGGADLGGGAALRLRHDQGAQPLRLPQPHVRHGQAGVCRCRRQHRARGAGVGRGTDRGGAQHGGRAHVARGVRPALGGRAAEAGGRGGPGRERAAGGGALGLSRRNALSRAPLRGPGARSPDRPRWAAAAEARGVGARAVRQRAPAERGVGLCRGGAYGGRGAASLPQRPLPSRPMSRSRPSSCLAGRGPRSPRPRASPFSRRCPVCRRRPRPNRRHCRPPSLSLREPPRAQPGSQSAPQVPVPMRAAARSRRRRRERMCRRGQRCRLRVRRPARRASRVRRRSVRSCARRRS